MSKSTQNNKISNKIDFFISQMNLEHIGSRTTRKREIEDFLNNNYKNKVIIK